jgi:hypothetical protein
MAKRHKKHAKRRTHRRSRKMSGIGAVSSMATNALMITGGLVASRIIVNAAGKAIPALVKTPMTKALGQAVLGLITKPVVSTLGIKSSKVDSLAEGMYVGAMYELLKSVAPTMIGADDDDVIVVSGTDISEVNGIDQIGADGMDISEVNGLDQIGYDEDYDY